jgi:eukaryotic-like serine/threonine-protein kinase
LPLKQSEITDGSAESRNDHEALLPQRQNLTMSFFDDDSGEWAFRFRSGGLEVDQARGEVRVDGRIVALEPKPLGVLLALIEQPMQVVSRPELLERLWGRSAHLSDNVLANAVMRLRRALGPELGALIRNVAGQGYLFDAKVERVAIGRRFESAFDLQPGIAVPGRESYVLDAPLGSSSQSEVWLARHAKTHDRRVFKFCSSGERLSALKREFTLYRVLRESLGDRDDYARVLDANFATEPFFLECAFGGESLGAWAANGDPLAAMSLDERLALFMAIARPVADAHRVGVLHKDLKPSNVLVEAAGDSGAGPSAGRWITRITDFGSGRLLSPETLQRFSITQMGLTMTSAVASDSGSGTLIYLAPELFGGAVPTVQSDVYALGLMLYQIVVADMRRPMATGWESGISDALLREDIAAATQGQPQARLHSVDELIARLQSRAARHDALQRAEEQARRAQRIDDELARARARRPWVVAALVSLGLGLVASAGFYQRERTALVEAEAQAGRAQAINDFLTLDVLQSADVTQLPRGAGVNMADLLQRASARVGPRMQGQPGSEASVRETLARLFLAITDSNAAEAEFRRALDLLTPLLPDAHERVVSLRFELARVLAMNTKLDEAQQLLQRAERDVGAQRLAGSTELAYQGARTRFAVGMLSQRHPQALPEGLRALALLDRLYPQRLAQRFSLRRELANVQMRVDDADKAKALMNEALAPPFAPDSVGEITYARGQLQQAQLQIATGDTQTTEALLLGALDVFRRSVGPDDSYVAMANSLLGDLYVNLGQLDKASAPLAAAYDSFLRTRGPNAQLTQLAAINRSVALLYGGRAHAAREALESQRTAMLKLGGEDSPAIQGIDFFRAVSLTDTGDTRQALALLQRLDAGKLAQASPGNDWPQRLQAERGRAMIGAGQREAGIAELEAGVSGMEQRGSAEIFLAPLRSFLDAQRSPPSTAVTIQPKG